MHEKKQMIFLIVLLICVLGGMMYLMSVQTDKTEAGHTHTGAAATQTEEKESGFAGTPTGIGGPFSMTDHHGNAVTEKDYADKYKTVFFGFTHCHAICPGELQKLSEVLDILAETGDDKKIAPLFVTIDPERDGVEEMKEYVALFDDRIIGLTGTREQVDHMKDTFKAHAEKVEMEMMEPGQYMMDHSSFTYLMSPDNKLLLIFEMKDSAESVAKEIRSAL
mgnify:CR=1 FL=1